MGARLYDDSVMENHDGLRVSERAEPVRDHDHGPFLHQSLQSLYDERFGFSIERRRRLVEDQDRRVANEGARDADALALSSRERRSALADDRVVTLGQSGDEFVGVREPGGIHDVDIGRVVASVRDVVANRAVKQDRLLQHEADLAAQPA